MNLASDILIIGGGIIGLSLAVELRSRGASVTIVCRDFKQAATHAAAGMLAPQAEGIPPGPMLDLCLKSRSFYPEWIPKLEAKTDVAIGYWPCGILALVYREANLPADSELEYRASPGTGVVKSQYPMLDAQWLSREAIHLHQPGLSSEVAGGWWYPEDGQVDNRALTQALWTTAQHLGVDLREGVAVEALQQQNRQILSVKTSAGDWQAEHYVLATGAWSNELLPVPVYPRKGQMLSVQVPVGALDELPLKRVLFGSQIYIVPRRDGRIIVGATSEDVGFTPYNTPAGIQALLQQAIRLYPALEQFPIQEFWWGFRPATPDELPILGSGPCENLTLATGHYRNGILLAPVTSFLLADLILNQKSDPLLDSFHYGRFYRQKNNSNGVVPKS